MPITKLGTVFIQIANIERSLDFYCGLLGLDQGTIQREEWDNGQKAATLFLNYKGAPLITLVQSESAQADGKRLINLQCTDVEQVHRALKEKGFRLSNIADWKSEWNQHYHFDVYDPDGNVINVIEMIKLEA